MLEPYVVKAASPVLRWLGAGNGSQLLGNLSRTVLRRGRASNRFSLFGVYKSNCEYYLIGYDVADIDFTSLRISS
ncbi:MAG: hypothetical protein C5S41_13215 [Candidatus Methanomarinus sp.]|nr:MAG: hypothetical protein C5S41_13215 [ANME-2 cluster archaeon]